MERVLLLQAQRLQSFQAHAAAGARDHSLEEGHGTSGSTVSPASSRPSHAPPGQGVALERERNPRSLVSTNEDEVDLFDVGRQDAPRLHGMRTSKVGNTCLTCYMLAHTHTYVCATSTRMSLHVHAKASAYVRYQQSASAACADAHTGVGQ